MTDFQIAENLSETKILKLKENHKILHTSFIIDSIAAGKQQNWRSYRHWNDTYRKRSTKGDDNDNIQGIIGYLSRPSNEPGMLHTVYKIHLFPELNVNNIYVEKSYNNPERDVMMPSLVAYLKGKSLPESWSVFNNPNKSIYEFYRNSRLHWLSTWRMELADWARSIEHDTDHCILDVSNKAKAIFHIDIGLACTVLSMIYQK